MEKTSKKTYRNIPYELGDMTSTVYYVRGGLEDWAYAIGWEESQQGYTCIADYDLSDVASLVYLIETDPSKAPAESELGKESELFDFNLEQIGQITRNMRLTWAIFDQAQPYIPEVTMVNHDESGMTFEWTVRGCIHADQTWVEATLDNGEVLLSSEQASACNWSAEGELADVVVSDSVRIPNDRRVVSFAAKAITDQAFGNQNKPDPNVGVNLHLSKMRLKDHYEVNNSKGDHLEGGKVIVSDEYDMLLS